MKAALFPVLSGLLIAPEAFAGPLPNSGLEGRSSGNGSYLLAQSYDFDVFIDQYGREVVLDPQTGRVVEIRPPAVPRPRAEERRLQREWELGRRDLYDDRDLEIIERLRRERLREERRMREEPLYGDDDFYRRQRGTGEEERGIGEAAPVERRPLEEPTQDDRELASVPEASDIDEAIEQSTIDEPTKPGEMPRIAGVSEEVIGYQVLLDRAGASPGVIDGRMGDNVNKAIDAYKEITGQTLRTYDKEWVAAELEATGGPALIEYTITPEDAAGPYVASVPDDYGEKAKLEKLAFTSVPEALAERFHMDEKLLRALNPKANFNRPGTVIRVVNTGEPVTRDVARIVADKGRRQVRAYDSTGKLVSAYPATIGSDATPSPSGTHEVTRVAFDPNYTYNPKINFKQGDNDKVLTIPPGPNGPVGTIWIALSKPTYGIHGTPEPSKIGKTSSHGCVRLTNWDAHELAKRVKPGVTVEFSE
ncbi:L,D-transpeptidase family protein [Nitratireductor basaltis]|uniref:ErfK/YbiS/YcfS/YnhG protein n=1 Tax=Nitratireductor basaltis TaxID=472175 RepID=A0A084U7Q0_9HYPH|nr:L,D-transpeptidase family protein [Nitratireductor basaltis]KFB08986.1 ErfK/YbiS/YcfS/YnhG protein [Nitratireductor basaltis]